MYHCMYIFSLHRLSCLHCQEKLGAASSPLEKMMGFLMKNLWKREGRASKDLWISMILILISHHANSTIEINAINLRTADLWICRLGEWLLPCHLQSQRSAVCKLITLISKVLLDDGKSPQGIFKFLVPSFQQHLNIKSMIDHDGATCRNNNHFEHPTILNAPWDEHSMMFLRV